MGMSIDKLFGSVGLRLYSDASLANEIEQVEVIPAGDIYWNLTKFSGTRLHKCYLNDAGVFTPFTAYSVVKDKISLQAAQAKPILCLPKNGLKLIQIGTKSTPKCIFVKQKPEFKYSGFSITTLDAATGLPGPVLFCETNNGTFVPSLTLATVPSSLFVKTTLAVKGTIDTLPLLVTSDIYL